MSNEELLKPRYKVIADWPNTEFIVGNIITDIVGDWATDFYDKYPHLFKKLEWWEERKRSDLPKYLKREFINKKGNEVVEVADFISEHGVVLTDNRAAYLNWFYPATKEEYENQNINNVEI